MNIRTHLVAPSGFNPHKSLNLLALSKLKAAGLALENEEAVFRRYLRFAGCVKERAADFQALLEVPNMPELMLAWRGGFGALELLKCVDWRRLAAKMQENHTMLFGYSDVTAIQLALLSNGAASFVGPMPGALLAREKAPEVVTVESFARALRGEMRELEFACNKEHLPAIEGVLWGGNLSVIAALAGSPFCPSIEGGILLIEDVGEEVYRIERMLQTLDLLGILSKQQAIIFGDFGRLPPDFYSEQYTLQYLAQTLEKAVGIPVILGFPFGHIEVFASFPLGLAARLSVENHAATVQFSPYRGIAKPLNLAPLLG